MEYDEEFLEKVRLVASKAGLDEEEVLRRVEQYVREMKGFVKPDGALSLLAAELNVNLALPDEHPSYPVIKLDKLVPGMRKASVQGKIVRMYGVLEYVNRSGEPSERAEFKIADETGQIDVIVWSKSIVDMIKRGELKEGDVVRISNARVSERFGRIALHLNSGADIEILSGGYEDLEVLERKPLKVSEIYDKEGQEVDFKGIVLRIFPVSEFTRSDGSIGRRSSMLLRDGDGGTVRVVLWGDKAKLGEELVEGSTVLLEDVRVVIRDDSVELHTTPRTKIEVLEEVEGEEREFEATVLYKFPVEEVGIIWKRRYIDLLIEVNGDLDVLRVWGEKWVSLLESEVPPFRMRIGPTYRGEDGILVLSRSGEIEILKRIPKEIPPLIRKLAKKIKYRRMWIGESSDGLREFRGTVVYMSEMARVSWHCPNCGSRVEPEYGRYHCPNCGELERAIPLLHLTFLIDDGTGLARIVAFRDKAEAILGMTTDDVIRRADELGEATHSIPTEHVAEKIVGKEVIVRGRATYLESGIVKLILDEMEYAEPKEEAGLLIEEIKRLWLGSGSNEGNNG
ncbi:MAG TPA: hypothetical protein ENF57_02010 [Candidatus Korarchaeota archaeon]|nr:hypothetical protein [Candidatus Korarchaeota archaeon]